jgi:hypothetical protein
MRKVTNQTKARPAEFPVRARTRLREALEEPVLLLLHHPDPRVRDRNVQPKRRRIRVLCLRAAHRQQIILLHRWPRVQVDARSARADSHADLAVWRALRELDRVADQVHDHLHEAVAVAADRADRERVE